MGDITYLKPGESWLYLATVIDLATGMVTGWQLASHMRTSLVTDALAINNRPRKILGWKTPAEVFEEQLRSLQRPGVASTG